MDWERSVDEVAGGAILLIKYRLQFINWVCIYKATFLTTNHKTSSKITFHSTGGVTHLLIGTNHQKVFTVPIKPYSCSNESNATSPTHHVPEAHKAWRAVKCKMSLQVQENSLQTKETDMQQNSIKLATDFFLLLPLISCLSIGWIIPQLVFYVAFCFLPSGRYFMGQFGLLHPTHVNYPWTTLTIPVCFQKITCALLQLSLLCWRWFSCALDIKASQRFMNISIRRKPSKRCSWPHYGLKKSVLLVLLNSWIVLITTLSLRDWWNLRSIVKMLPFNSRSTISSHPA